MWRLIGKESATMSTCYPTRVGYNLCTSYIDINIGLYSRQLAQIHSAESGRGCLQNW